MTALTTRMMSDAHEEFLSELLDAPIMPGSGNQAANPMDVRQHRRNLAVAFAVDGKSTRGKSISVTKEMIAKAEDQARGERMMIGLRWYEDDRLRSFTDLIVIKPEDFSELQERSERLAEIERRMAAATGAVNDNAHLLLDDLL